MAPSEMLRRVPPFWAIVLLSVTLWGGEFLRRGLWEPDEARYAYVAREMRAEGHWFVPHVNGKPYPDKPPLMFWLINAASLLTGGRIDGVSARLPSLLGSILTLWVATRLLVRWHSPEAAWRAMLVLLTTLLFWHEGGWARIDALLCGLVMVSVYLLFTSIEDRHQLLREMLAYAVAGLAILAKGPVGLALPMGILAMCVMASGDARKLRRLHWVWGPLVAVAIPAVWLILARAQNPPSEYFAAMFGQKSFGRVVEGTGHAQPPYYFLLYFPLDLLPWTLFLPAALASAPNAWLKRRLLGWMGFVIGLFSLFACKRNIYILAAYPACAMLVGAAWGDLAKLSRRWVTVTGWAALVTVWALSAAAVVAIFVPQVPFNRLNIVPSACVLTCGGLALTRVFRRERLSNRWFVLFCGVFLLFQITVSAVILPALNGLKGPVSAAETVRRLLPPDRPVYLFQQQLAILPLYADRPGRELTSLDELRNAIAANPEILVVFHEAHWLDVQAQCAPPASVSPFAMGKKRLVLVRFERRDSVRSGRQD